MGSHHWRGAGGKASNPDVAPHRGPVIREQIWEPNSANSVGPRATLGAHLGCWFAGSRPRGVSPPLSPCRQCHDYDIAYSSPVNAIRPIREGPIKSVSGPDDLLRVGRQVVANGDR